MDELIEVARSRLLDEARAAMREIVPELTGAARWAPTLATSLKKRRPDLWARAQELYRGDPYQTFKPLAESVLKDL